MTIEQLAAKNEHWVKVATLIVGCQDTAKDLVQETYIKLLNHPKLSEGLFYISLRNYIYDYLKKRQKHPCRIPSWYDTPDNRQPFEPDDKESLLLEAFASLKWIQKELLKEKATGRSLRRIEAEYDIHYVYAHRQIKEAQKTLLSALKKANNER